MIQAVLNWSGGKDSAFCLYKCLTGYSIQVKYLLTTLRNSDDRIPMHEVRADLLRKQAGLIGIILKEISLPANAHGNIYDDIMRNNLRQLKEEGIDHSVYGDIFLEDMRQYREERLAELEMTGLFPLWKMPSEKLMDEFIALGFKAVITGVDESRLAKSFVGREIDNSLINDLPANVDLCGENGEYHSFVYAGPVFSSPVPFKRGEMFYKPSPNSATGSNSAAGFWCLDLIAE
jgi:uncharacterized protein (TIGR00290 family)